MDASVFMNLFIPNVTTRFKGKITNMLSLWIIISRYFFFLMFSSRPTIMFLLSPIPLRNRFFEKQHILAIFSCDLALGEGFSKLQGRTAAKNVIGQVK